MAGTYTDIVDIVVPSMAQPGSSVTQVQTLTVEAESFTVVVGVIMAIWFGVFVISQIIRMFKGEAVERPPL